MEELNICEKLVKVLPEGAWCDNNFPGCVWYDGAIIRPELPDDTDHNCWFINWALDELALTSHFYGLSPIPDCEIKGEYVDVGWAWVGWSMGNPETSGFYVVNEIYPTKTLALAHALIALGENDG